METKQIEILQKKDRMPTINLVLFSIITAGLFFPLYIWKNTPLIGEKINKKVPSQGFLLSIMLCFGLSAFITTLRSSMLENSLTYICYQGLPDFVVIASVVAGLFSLAYAILLIIWSFKMVDNIREYATENNVKLKINKLWAFFLTALYVNYKINELAEE